MYINPTSRASDMYEFKMNLFDNCGTEGFILFQRNHQITIEASGNITVGDKIHYLHTLICGEALHKFETICRKIGNSNNTNLNTI